MFHWTWFLNTFLHFGSCLCVKMEAKKFGDCGFSGDISRAPYPILLNATYISVSRNRGCSWYFARNIPAARLLWVPQLLVAAEGSCTEARRLEAGGSSSGWMRPWLSEVRQLSSGFELSHKFYVFCFCASL